MAFFVRAHFYLFVLCLAIHYAESLRGQREYPYYPSEMYYYDDYDEDIYVSEKYSSFKKKPNNTTWYKVYKHGLAKINITDGTNLTKEWRNIRDYFFKNDSMNKGVEESMPSPYIMSLTSEDTNEYKQKRDILVEILLSVYDNMNLMLQLLERSF
ncbi:uncharacterized protein [Centruroides vittatus]|uniref:uncharacterized protein n=1 Tax=Centruroides vittatus TaxID=120091 RepID=UPI00350ED8B3